MNADAFPTEHRAAGREIRLRWLSGTIDQTLDNPADRMVLKLYLDNYDVEEIARFAGIAPDAARAMVERSGEALARRLGRSLKAIRDLCTTY